MNELINLGNGQFVKVTMLKGEKGSNIATITKTGTSGLVDTYTVTLTDGHTTTFEVTNGSSIESIEKTATVGLVDIYTITLTNGETSTFEVTNGNAENLQDAFQASQCAIKAGVSQVTFTNLGDAYITYIPNSECVENAVVVVGFDNGSMYKGTMNYSSAIGRWGLSNVELIQGSDVPSTWDVGYGNDSVGTRAFRTGTDFVFSSGIGIALSTSSDVVSYYCVLSSGRVSNNYLEKQITEKANLIGGNSINGVQILRDSRAWADIPNGSNGETVIEFKDRNDLNMGYIRPWKKSDGTPILDIYPPDNGGEIHLDGKIPVTKDQIVNSLLSNATDAPLSANEGNVLFRFLSNDVGVTPSTSGKSTLLSYILDVVYPKAISLYSFTAQGFPDLPESWTYQIVVTMGGGFINVFALSALDNAKFFARGIDAYNHWLNDWARLSVYEKKTWSGTIGSNGLINTGISTSAYMIVGVINDRAAICIPLSSGANWYVQCFDLGGSTPSGGNINLTLMCVRI